MVNQIEAMKQALDALESYHGYMEPLLTVFGGPRVPAEQSTTTRVEKAITTLRTAIEEAEKQEPVTILPDGSAYGMLSFPLPADHWLYAPNEYRDGEYEPIDLPKPILTHALREAVVAAVRYAVRGATMRGQEMDFDPDALVQNAVYALCGPYTTPPAAPVIDKSAAIRIATSLGWTPPEAPVQEPVGTVKDLFTNVAWERLDVVGSTKVYLAPPAAQRQWVELTNNELQPIADEYRILFGGWVEDFSRAIEAKLKEKNT